MVSSIAYSVEYENEKYSKHRTESAEVQTVIVLLSVIKVPSNPMEITIGTKVDKAFTSFFYYNFFANTYFTSETRK